MVAVVLNFTSIAKQTFLEKKFEVEPAIKPAVFSAC